MHFYLLVLLTLSHNLELLILCFTLYSHKRHKSKTYLMNNLPSTNQNSILIFFKIFNFMYDLLILDIVFTY